MKEDNLKLHNGAKEVDWLLDLKTFEELRFVTAKSLSLTKQYSTKK